MHVVLALLCHFQHSLIHTVLMFSEYACCPLTNAFKASDSAAAYLYNCGCTSTTLTWKSFFGSLSVSAL